VLRVCQKNYQGEINIFFDSEILLMRIDD
jgi:hypothetical protein